MFAETDKLVNENANQRGMWWFPENVGNYSMFCTQWFFITYGFWRFWTRIQWDNTSNVKANINSRVGSERQSSRVNHVTRLLSQERSSKLNAFCLFSMLLSSVIERVNSNMLTHAACVKPGRESQSGHTTLESSRARWVNVDSQLLVLSQSRTHRMKSDAWLLYRIRSSVALNYCVKWDANSEEWLLSPWWLLVTQLKRWLLTFESNWAPKGEQSLLSLM